MNPENLDKLGPHDVILAGYPGSGAAWIGSLLVKLGVFYVEGYHELLHDQMAQKSTVMPITRRERLPILQGRDRENVAYAEPYRVIKTHLEASQVGQRPFSKVLLLVRDGRDAVLSYYHWLKNFGGLESNLGQFLTHGTKDEPLPPARAWSQFYSSWLTRSADVATHVVRFEDLRNDPMGGLQAIVSFLGASRSDAELEQAIEACSFKAMQQQEAQAVAHSPDLGQGKIMRRGEVGEWKHALSPGLLKVVEQDAAAMLSDLGYQDLSSQATAAGTSATDTAALQQPSSTTTHEAPSPSFDREGSQLVFLISLPRSGSTLLQRVLGGHPELHTVSEPWIMLHPLYALRWRGIEAEYSAPLARQALRDFLDELPGGESTYLQAVREMASVLYGAALQGSGKRLFLDKTPRYHHIIGDLHRVFPKAKFIFLIRNPLSVFASVLDSWFQNNPDALKATSDHYCDLRDGWRNILVGIREVGAAGITIRYEDLVQNPEKEVEALCRHLQVPMVPAMIEYGKSAPPKGSFGDQIGVPKHSQPVTESLDKWQQTLVRPANYQAAKEYLAYLGDDVLGRLGYDKAQLDDILDSRFLEATLSSEESLDSLPEAVRREAALTLCAEGESAFEAAQLDTAIESLTKAIRIHPSCARAANDLGAILWAEGERRMAIGRFAQAFAMDPHDKTTALNLSDALAAEGREGDARGVCLHYLSQQPDDQEMVHRICTLAERNEHDADPGPASFKLIPQYFPDFTYSCRSHFARLGLPAEHSAEDIDNCNLKIYQDMLMYRFVLDNFPAGSRLLEIGGGDSRVIRWLRDRYEFWNLDKLEGAGNGLTELADTNGFRLVRDYIGAFSKELPDNYFDGVFSLSTLEHVPEDTATLKAICDDIHRILKPGGLSAHAFDILMKDSGFWIHALIPYLHEHIPTLNPARPNWLIRADPDAWGMSRQGYERLWQPITKQSFKEFGVPMSYNVFWQKD
ncbi:MAG TPA: sulfotransferase [Rhodocyclaceae bacterium]|nr:sulfotransferase [Rhodocyclaceae bacterium]